MDKILAVFDTDALYATRLMEYLKKKNNTGFEVTAFTRTDCLLEFASRQKIELLLLGEDMQPETIPKDNIKYVFSLAGQRESGGEAYPVIYKYQSADKVLAEIISCYCRLENKFDDSSGSGKVSVISVFSPVPDSNKSFFSWYFAGCLSKKKKVLFIPMEPFPVSMFQGSEVSDASLSEVIYYLKEKNPSLITKIKPLLKVNDKLFCLSGISHGFDLLALNKEDVHRLIDEIKSHTDYEAVVFWLGIYTEAIMDLINLSDSVYILTNKNISEGAALKEWKRQMKLTGLDTEQEKYKVITLPCRKQAEFSANNYSELKENEVWQLAVSLAESS